MGVCTIMPDAFVDVIHHWVIPFVVAVVAFSEIPMPSDYRLGHTTEGFYDTAVERSDSMPELREIVPRRSPR